MEKQHWADKIAKKLIALHPDKDTFVCASGITPSGIVHIGNFRDIITSDMASRALKDKGYNVELLFFWDDYDRFRKVPEGIPKSFSKFIGLPLSEIPDPYNCHKSYAEHFEKEFEKSLPKLGITPTFIYQTKEYKKNKYYESIKIALQNRKKVARILAKFKTQKISQKEIENYFPLRVYCRQCKKDTTEIKEYNEENIITYSCRCGHKETVDISKENVGKLAWKVDWAMRWFYYKVSFEPGGRDHAAPGGSYEISKIIAKEVFGIQAPLFQLYEFIGLQGLTSKMSSSLGIGVSPKDLLKIYEPELLRWLFARVRPEKPFNFYFGSELIKQYNEFDKTLEKYFNGRIPGIKGRGLFFSKTDSKKEFVKKRVPFRQVASFGQASQGNFNEFKKMFRRIGQEFEEKHLKQRLENSQNWIEGFAKHLKIRVRKSPNKNYYNRLNKEEKEQIKKLREGLDAHWSLEQLTRFVYFIPKKPRLSEDEKKARQRDFFKNVYYILIDLDTGPRLATFLIALGKERVKKLLRVE